MNPKFALTAVLPDGLRQGERAIEQMRERQRYIDFFCGSGALNSEHNNPYIKKGR